MISKVQTHNNPQAEVKQDKQCTYNATEARSRNYCCRRNAVSMESYRETTVAQWLRCCATIRKVAGSIPAGVSGFFTDIKSFRSHYGSGVDSASNINEYQEYFLGVKATGA